MKQERGKLLFAGLIVLLTVIGCCVMLSNTNEGLLTVFGLANLKFFTVDSNILIGLVYLAYLILAAAGSMERSDRLRLWMERMIYIATTAVSLTFVVVVCFFAPSLGLAPLLQDANLYFHLIIPVLAIAGFAVFRRDRLIPMWETALPLIPSVLYGLYYTAILLAEGVRFPDTDWYGFASGGVIGSVIIAAMIFLMTWGLALLLRLVSGGIVRQAGKRNSKV